MSLAEAQPTNSQTFDRQSASATSDFLIREVLQRVEERIAPVWPLRDYVAVNPWLGFTELPWAEAHQYLQQVSRIALRMEPRYYGQQFLQGEFDERDLEAAWQESRQAESPAHQQWRIADLKGWLADVAAATHDRSTAGNSSPRAWIEAVDALQGTHWRQPLDEEISRYCSGHYDLGQAAWANPWRELSLYEAWRSAAVVDASWECWGVAGFRLLVGTLPLSADAALHYLLQRWNVPAEHWETLLLSEALANPGWSAWTRYQSRQAIHRGEENHDFAGLLAMRIAYQVALSENLGINWDWSSWFAQVQQQELTRDDWGCFLAQRASEIAYRRQLLQRLSQNSGGGASAPAASADSNSVNSASVQISESTSAAATSSLRNGTPAAARNRSLAQLVFCIDVRSERIRRHLESVAPEIETYGFAGFFGVPMAWRELGQLENSPQLPALLHPKFEVQQELVGIGDQQRISFAEEQATQRFWRRSWKEFQTSITSCFGFVESSGWWYGWELWRKSWRWMMGERGEPSTRTPSTPAAWPSLRGLNQQGLSTTAQIDLAEGILRGIGLTEAFAPLVVFCGHVSSTENNPLAAALDCGACCGHSGEPNAKFAAVLLNQNHVRQGLQERGIDIPADVLFLAAVHDTTTDELRWHLPPETSATQQVLWEELACVAHSATQRTRRERWEDLPGPAPQDVLRRSLDWSEVRPEWGLAGNAAFIVGPRSLTRGSSFEGRTFLHSYTWQNDREFRVLEQIMTAQQARETIPESKSGEVACYLERLDAELKGSRVEGQANSLRERLTRVQTGLEQQQLDRRALGDAIGFFQAAAKSVVPIQFQK